MPQCIVPLDENGTGECGGRLNGFSIERPKQREIREIRHIKSVGKSTHNSM